MRVKCLLFFLIALGSCVKKNSTVLIDPKNSLLFNSRAILHEAGEVVFDLDSVTQFWHYSINYSNIQNDEYFSLINTPDNSISIYNINKPDSSKKIFLDYDGPNGVGHLEAASHLLLSIDSIVVYNPNYGILYLLNSTGKVVKKYTVVNLKDNGLNKAIPEPSSYHP